MILKSIRELYIALYQRTIAPLTAFSAITDPVLDDATSYPVCTISEHRFLITPGFPLDEPYPETTGHTPHAIPGQPVKIRRPRPYPLYSVHICSPISRRLPRQGRGA
jgi:hypothetical protein